MLILSFLFLFISKLILPETIRRAVIGHVARNINYKNINPNPRAEKYRASDSRGD
jgi:hypothetical protein